MIQKILKNIRKYHEANFWIAERKILEEKKRQAAAPETVLESTPAVYEAVGQKRQVVFTHDDVGHSQEERNKIQGLYAELGNVLNPGRLAI